MGLHSVAIVLVLGYSMLHRIRERNIPGGGRVPNLLPFKVVRRCCRWGLILTVLLRISASTLDCHVHGGAGLVNTLRLMPCSPHLHHEQQCPSRGHCFHDQHPRWQLPRATIRPHGAQSKVWGSLSAVAGGSGRLVWVIFCLGFFVSSTSSVSLSQT